MGLLNNLANAAFGDNLKNLCSAEKKSEGMYQDDLEKLISIALADGNITETERKVLHNKAAKYDIDPDEIDMVLESRLAERHVQTSSQVEHVQIRPVKKTGPKKCPACGALLMDNNAVYCPECGYKVINVVSDLITELNAIVPQKKEKKNGGLFGNIVALIEDNDEDVDIEEKKADIILNFNVPNTKETVLEFLAYSTLKGDKGGWNCISKAWYNKSVKVITTARETFSSDRELMKKLKDYAVTLRMEKKGLFNR